MTEIVSATAVSEDFGLVTTLHLDEEDAWEILRSNFCEEVPVGDVDGIVRSLDEQQMSFDVTPHEIDLSDVSIELPDLKKVYEDIYSAIDSHAYGEAAGVGYCVCRGWDSASLAHNFNDHVTMEILNKLSVPIAGPTT